MFRNMLVCLLVTCSLALADKLPSKKHTVIALLVKNGSLSAPPDVNINGKQIMSKNLAAQVAVPQQGAQFQGPQLQGLLQQGPPPQGPQLTAVMQQNILPPKPVAPLLQPMAEPPTPPAKLLIKPQNKPADEKKKKKAADPLLPCEDYSPICSYYGKDSQCRDVWMQRHCRKYCGLCDVPIGVFLGCVDMKHCHNFGKSQCMHEWVRKTCKSKCGQCGFSREAASDILIGKKRESVLKVQKEKDQHINDVKKTAASVTKEIIKENPKLDVVVKQQKQVIVPTHDTEGSTEASGSADDATFAGVDVRDDGDRDDDVEDEDDDDVDDDVDDDEDDEDVKKTESKSRGNGKNVKVVDEVKSESKKVTEEVKKNKKKSDKVVAKVSLLKKSLKASKNAGKKGAKRMFLKHKPCRRS